MHRKILILTLLTIVTNAWPLRAQETEKPSPPVAGAIEKGDLESFKKLVSKSTLKSDDHGDRRFGSMEESELMTSLALHNRWDMLGHLFSLGAPKDSSRIADFVVKVPSGAKIIESFIANHPQAKGEAGTELLCSLIYRFEVSGADKPHPLIVKLVDGGVPLEAGRYSALVAAVEFRDLVLIDYFKKAGADSRKKANWHIHSSDAGPAIGEVEFSAPMLAGMLRCFDAAAALVPVNEFIRKEKAKFEKAYPPQPDSPLVGTYEIVQKRLADEPIAMNQRFRLLADSSALLPGAGLIGATAWIQKGDEIELHPFEAEGPSNQFVTVMKLTDKPGVLVISKLNGMPVEGVTAYRMGSGGDEFSVPADSLAIGKWVASIEDDGAPKLEIEIHLGADGKGKMSAEQMKMDLVWKLGDSKTEIETFVVQGGNVQRSSVMKLSLSADGNTLSAEDHGGPKFHKSK